MLLTRLARGAPAARALLRHPLRAAGARLGLRKAAPTRSTHWCGFQTAPPGTLALADEDRDNDDHAVRGQRKHVHTIPSELKRLAVLPLAFVAPGSGSSAHAVATASAAAVPAPLVGPMAVKALQILPPIACQAAFLAPLDAMRKIKAANTTGDLPLVPYASMFLNGVLWITYGLLKNDMTIAAPNITALVMGAYYCKTFAAYAPADFSPTPYLLGGTAMTAGIVGTALLAEPSVATNALGLLGNGIVVMMFGGPLAAIRTVIRDKSTEALPFAMTVATFANCVLWSAYGALVVHDPYIWFCNGLGLLSATVQLGLFAKYGVYRKVEDGAHGAHGAHGDPKKKDASKSE